MAIGKQSYTYITLRLYGGLASHTFRYHFGQLLHYRQDDKLFELGLAAHESNLMLPRKEVPLWYNQ